MMTRNFPSSYYTEDSKFAELMKHVKNTQYQESTTALLNIAITGEELDDRGALHGGQAKDPAWW